MPAFYTHYRFGRDVLKDAPAAVKAVCEKERGLFDIGLHGRGLFFFYRPIIRNGVSRIGYEAHHHSGREFLARGKKVLAGARDKTAARAYLYGLLCHFALDSVCHPYVAQAMSDFNVTHAAVETALDRSLLIADGIRPSTFDPCGHFEVTHRNAAVIAPFYPPATSDLVEKSLNSMVFYGRVLFNQKRLFRTVIDKALYVTLHHDSIADMLMTPERDARCTESDEHLHMLYNEALPLAQDILAQADSYIESGMRVTEVFDKTFEG